MPHKPKVFVVDDDLDVRGSLEWLLRAAGFEAAAFASAEAFLDHYRPSEAACLVLDVYLPRMNGLALLRHLQAIEPRLAVIMMTGHGDIPMAVEAIKSGAFDFVEKPYTDGEMLQRVEEALDARSGTEQPPSADRWAPLDPLTPREREVLNLIVDGKSNRIIADRLGIGIRTVETHRQHLMEKMQVSSLAELVRVVLVGRRTSRRATPGSPPPTR